MFTKELTKAEFDCKHTGENNMQQEFMFKLQMLRLMYGKALSITSGFRSAKHPSEAKKAAGPGWHNKGLAVDLGCHAEQAFQIVSLAFSLGFTGIGISQKNGLARFIHLDMRSTTPVVYSY